MHDLQGNLQKKIILKLKFCGARTLFEVRHLFGKLGYAIDPSPGDATSMSSLTRTLYTWPGVRLR